jgi:hypothetical protein
MNRNLIAICLLPLLLAACICPLTRKTNSPVGYKKSESSPQWAGAFHSKRDTDIGLPEQVKAYSIGRYVDPADPNTLHERHAIYRREQTAHWNLAGTRGVGASRSYYLTADKSQQDKQQRAYYEAAQEQARLAKEQLAAKEKRFAELEQENSKLKEKTRPSLL